MQPPRLVKRPKPKKAEAVPHIEAVYPSTRKFLYHAPEADGEVFLCIARGCQSVVPHREFFCAEHWARPGISASKIKYYQRKYRAALGAAIDKIEKQDAVDGGTAAGVESAPEIQIAP